MPDFRFTVYGHLSAPNVARAEALVERFLTVLEDAGADRLGATLDDNAWVRWLADHPPTPPLSTPDHERQGDDIGQ